MLSNLHEIASLNQAAPMIVQNPDGSFTDYLPGLDGPVHEGDGDGGFFEGGP